MSYYGIGDKYSHDLQRYAGMFAERRGIPDGSLQQYDPLWVIAGASTTGGSDSHIIIGLASSSPGTWPDPVIETGIELVDGKIIVKPGIVLDPTTEAAAPDTKGSMMYDSGTDELKYYDGAWQIVSAGGLSAHALDGAYHTATGLTVGWVLSADSATTFSWKAPTGGGDDPDAIHDDIANEITAITPKTTLGSTDEFILEDGGASFVKKAVTFANIESSISLANLGTRTHGSLSDAPTSAHHVRYADSEVESVITAEIVDGQSIDNAIDSLIGTHTSDDNAHHEVFESGDFTTSFAAESLANLTTRAHSNLSDAPADAHHVAFVLADFTTAFAAESLANLATRTHANLSDAPTDAHHNQSHVLSGSDHTATGLTVGWVIAADSPTTFSWQAPTGGMSAHDLTGAYHTEDATGGAGNVIRATGATSFAWDTLAWGDLDLTSSSLADLATRTHASLSDAPADAHHVAFVLTDFTTAFAAESLANLATRTHASLSDAPTSAHHVRYADSEAVSAVQAANPLVLTYGLTVGGNLTFPTATFGTYIPYQVADTGVAPVTMSQFQSLRRGVLQTLHPLTGEKDHFYLIDRQSAWTIGSTGGTPSGENNIFNNQLDSNCLITVADLPYVLTITYSTTITATDVLYLEILGHRLSSGAFTLKEWKVEVRETDGSIWWTVLDRSGVTDLPNIAVPLWITGMNGVNYEYIDGIRLTITSADGSTWAPTEIYLAKLALINTRPSGTPAEAIGALDIVGGTVYGNVAIVGGDLTAANVVTAGNVDGVDVSEEPARISTEIDTDITTHAGDDNAHHEVFEASDFTTAFAAEDLANLASRAYSSLTDIPSTFDPTSHGQSAHTGDVIPDANQSFAGTFAMTPTDTTGDLFAISSTVTLSSALTGIDIDFSGVTDTSQQLRGMEITMPTTYAGSNEVGLWVSGDGRSIYLGGVNYVLGTSDDVLLGNVYISGGNFYMGSNAYIAESANAFQFYTGITPSLALTIDASQNLTLASIEAAVADHDKFLVSDSGKIEFRTGAEVASDIGAATVPLALTDLASYTQGSIIIGGGADWEPLVAGTLNYVLKMGAAEPAWGQVNWSELSGSQPAPVAHNLIDTTGHPVSGLTGGHFLKALTTTTYGFEAHGLSASDVGAYTTAQTDSAIDTDITTHTGDDNAHHEVIETTDVESIITAEIVDGQSIDVAIDALITTHDVADNHLNWKNSVGTIHTDNYIEYTDAAVESVIDAEIVDGQSIDVAIDALINTHNVANRHIDHSAVTITAGVGLSGGGTIAESRTIDCDITQYTDAHAQAACVSNAAYQIGWSGVDDVAASKNVLYDKISGMDTLIAANTTVVEVEAVITAEIVDGQSIDNAIDALISTHNVADRHIDHSTVSVIAGTGLSGGGTIAADRTINCDITQYTNVMAVAAVVAENPLALTYAIKIGGDSIEDSAGSEMIGFTGAGYIDFLGGQGTPSNQDVLAWSTSNSRWEVQAQSGGGGITGSGTANVLTKWLVGGSTIQDSIISDDGSIATVDGALTVSGALKAGGDGFDVDATGNITDVTVVAATVDTDKFIVQDGSQLKYRTGAQVLSDIGAAATSHAIATHSDATITGAYLEALLMFGSANAAWVPCIFEGSSVVDYDMWDESGSLIGAGGTDDWVTWRFTFPCNRGSLKLYLNGIRWYQHDADTSDFVTYYQIRGLDSAGGRNNLNSSTTNETAVGEKPSAGITFAAVDASANITIIVLMQRINAIAGNLEITNLALRCYYGP